MTISTGPHQHWGGVLNILNAAFTPDQVPNSTGGGSSSLDAIEKAYDELTQAKLGGRSQSEREQATHAAVSKIFDNYPNLENLRLSNEKIKSIRQAADYLKSNKSPEDLAGMRDKGWFTEKIIEIAEQRMPSSSSSSGTSAAERQKLGRALAAYADRLEYVFGIFEQELSTRMLVQSRGVTRDNWENDITEEFEQTIRSQKLLDGIEENFKQGNIKLIGTDGEEIKIPPKPPETPFLNYLHDTLLPVLMNQMGIDADSAEAKAILQELGSRQEETPGLKMMSFMLFLNFRGTPEAEKLKLALAGMGNQVPDRSGEYLMALVGAGDPKRNYLNADLAKREITIRADRRGSPEVSTKDTYRPIGFGKDVVLQLESKLRLPRETPGKIIPWFRIDLQGLEVNPDLDKMRNAVALSGIRHRVWDPEEPMDLSLHQTEGTRPASRPPTPTETSRATLQVLEGKPDTEGPTFYVGAIIPPELAQAGIASLPEQFPAGQIRPLSQPHMTLIPPSRQINSELNVGEACPDHGLDVKFDLITLSPRGNIPLMSSEAGEFKATASAMISDLGINVDPSERRPHAVLGSIPEELKEKIFANPEEYGFEMDPDLPGFLRYRLTAPLELSLETSPEMPLEQQLLKIQFEAGGVSLEKAEKVKENFRQRISRVQEEQAKMLQDPTNYQFTGTTKRKSLVRSSGFELEEYTKRPPFTKTQLELAVRGAPGMGRIPLNFSSRPNGVELWKEFQADVHKLFKSYGIDDATIQVLGSGVHGFSRNPDKDFKLWSLESDVDLAIFSPQLAKLCLEENVAYNKKIKMFGKFMVFKNEVDGSAPGIGFHDTPIGKDISELMERWSIKLFGPNCPPDHVDFKMNIGSQPFSDEGTIDVLSSLNLDDSAS